MKINEDLIRFHCNELADILVKKNHDYGNSVQEQFEEYGLDSILIRLDDKMRRLKTLRTHNPKIIAESLQDTLQDLAGYSILGSMCLQHKTKKIPANFEGKVVGTPMWTDKKPPYADIDDN